MEEEQQVVKEVSENLADIDLNDGQGLENVTSNKEEPVLTSHSGKFSDFGTLIKFYLFNKICLKI